MATLIAGIGRPVSRERIIDSVWEGAPRTARAQVHSAISSIRKTLSSCGVNEGVETQGSGYVLTVPRNAVDLYAVTDELDELIRTATTDGPSMAVADRIRDAVARIATPPFLDVDSLWTSVLRERVEEQVLTAHEVRLGMEIELGRARGAVQDLIGLAVRHPDRAALGALTMRALWGAGRRLEALNFFHRTRRRTVDQFGVEPDVQLRELYQEILDADGSPEPRRPRNELVRPDHDRHPPRMLPPLVSRTVGRHLELAFLLENVADPVEWRSDDPPTTIVITGYAGVGKSHLAQHLCWELAGRFPAGQLYADLGGSSGHPRRPEDAMRDFLSAFGSEPPHPTTSAGELHGLYRSTAADRPLLVLLEDVSCDGDLELLVPPGASSVVVVTSRTRLGRAVRGVRIDLQLPGADDLVEMLATRIGRGRVSAEHAAACLLAHRSGLLPAAIAAIAAEVDARPHRSLQEALDAWSGEQAPLEAVAFGGREVARRLAGSMGLVSAPAGRLLEALADSGCDSWPTWVGELLVSDRPELGRELVDELVRARLLDIATKGEERLVLAPLIRAAVRSGPGGEAQIGREWPDGWRRVLGGWLLLIDCALAGARLPLQGVWTARARRSVLAPELCDRVRSAGPHWVRSTREALLGAIRIAAQIEPDACLDLALSASELFEDLGDLAAWAESLEYAGVAASMTQSTKDRAGVLLARGRLALARRDHDQARADLESARRLLGCDADRRALAHIDVRLGWLCEARGELDLAEKAYRDAIATFSTSPEQRTTLAQVLHRLGSVLLERGEVGEAGDLADASYGLVVRAGSRKQIAQARLLLGAVDLARSEQAAAESVFGEVLGTARRHRDPRLEAHALWGLAWSHAASARIESGAKLLEEAVRLAHADDDRYLLAHLLHDRRTLLAGEQRDEGVAGRHEAAIVLFKGLIADAGSGVAAATQPGEVSVPQPRRSSRVRDEVGDGDRRETVDDSRGLLGALRDQCV